MRQIKNQISEEKYFLRDTIHISEVFMLPILNWLCDLLLGRNLRLILAISVFLTRVIKKKLKNRIELLHDRSNF